MILLSSLNNLLANDNGNSPSTGDLSLSDSLVTININLLKQANIKLIQRKYLIKINNQKDSVINLKNDYINKQQDIIDEFRITLEHNEKINKVLEDKLNKQKKLTKTITYGGTGIILGLVIGILCK